MAFNFGRQESVTDDELFGEGRSSSLHPAPGINENACYNNIPVFDDLLPNFSLLDVNSTSNSPDNGEKEGKNGELPNKEVETHQEIKSARDGSIVNEKCEGQVKDFKTVYRNKGSVSTIEGKRDRFRYRSDIEVFDDDEMYEPSDMNAVRIVRKSNSLPDLIPSRTSSSSTKCHSDNSNLSPDVTLSSINSLPSNRDLEEKKRQKDSFEGKSTVKDTLSGLSGSLQRSIPETEDEGFTEDNDDFVDTLSDAERRTKDVSKKRELYSRSSGYQTGSESRDKSKGSVQSQISQVSNISQVSSEPWTSSEATDTCQIDQNIAFGNLPLMSGFGEGFADFHIDGAKSVGTKIESTNSEMSTASDETKTPVSVIGENETTPKDPSLTFKRLKTESYSETGSVVIPNVKGAEGGCDSSVCIGQNTFEQIQHEAKEELQKQVDKWTRGSLNPASLMPSNDPRSSITDFQTLNKENWRVLFEEKLKKGEDIQDLLKHLHDSSSSTPSPSPAYTGQVISPGQKFTRNCLERGSLCCMEDCGEKACKKLRAINKVLEKTLVPDGQEEELLQQYLEALIQHHSYCEDIWCKVKYCQHLSLWNVDDVGILKDCIRKHLKEPVLSVLASNDYIFEQICNQNMSKEDLNLIIPVSLIGSFGSSILCIDSKQHMCVVKQYVLFEAGHQMSTYKRLVERHPYIVDQLWILEHGDMIQICTDFMPGGSLYDYLRHIPEGRLDWLTAMNYLLQMLSAVIFLHINGVVFLNWHSKNMQFTDTSYRSIKLNNFCLSYPLNVQNDIGSIKQCLLPAITPPELVQADGRLSIQSDMWGVGCQVYELLTGNVVWHEHRHESREYFHKKVCCKIPSLSGDFTEEQVNVFKSCWQLNPKERFSPEKLYDYITKCLRNHSRNNT